MAQTAYELRGTTSEVTDGLSGSGRIADQPAWYRSVAASPAGFSWTARAPLDFTNFVRRVSKTIDGVLAPQNYLLPRSCEVEVVTVERTQFGILQRERIVSCGNDNILTNLGCMGENVGETVERGLAELNCVVRASAGRRNP